MAGSGNSILEGAYITTGRAWTWYVAVAFAARQYFLRAAATRLACLPLFRALLTTPHGLLLPVADQRPLVGHLGEL
jgi:hypothetical protein